MNFKQFCWAIFFILLGGIFGVICTHLIGPPSSIPISMIGGFLIGFCGMDWVMHRD